MFFITSSGFYCVHFVRFHQACFYRVGELQAGVDQRQVLIVQARFQADDVIDDCLLDLSEPITEQVSERRRSQCDVAFGLVPITLIHKLQVLCVCASVRTNLRLCESVCV